LPRETRSESRVPGTREKVSVTFREVEMLKDLNLSKMYVSSDGFHKIMAFSQPVDGAEEMSKAMVLAIAKQMPLEVLLRDPDGEWGRVIWLDQEYASLKYASGFYNVWKRAELGVVKYVNV